MKNFNDSNQNGGTRQSGNSFMKKYGIVLSIAAAAMILGVTYASTGQQGLFPRATPKPAQSPAVLSTPAPQATVQPMDSGDAEPEPETVLSTPEPIVSTPSLPAAPADASLKILEPTVGTITRQYAMDKLIYSQTLSQWSTHEGMDVIAEAGAPVVAALDGRVEQVIQDSLLGNTVILTHEDGISTVYASLADVLVKTGDAVSQGQTIASVGNTALSEVNEGYHLHFEMYIDEESVDPRPYLAPKGA